MKKNILNIFLNFLGGIFFWLFFGLFFPILLHKRAGYYFFDKNHLNSSKMATSDLHIFNYDSSLIPKIT